ncbi:hypothetical protein [Pseudozobellia thermophila]|uniref:hypothetical protein n=1 Tax=Pseudozobellia thermophila TaxID=192903 RepID=UPI001114B664|nr:hypothetical protein [Pseudozobellia thermophila]
MKQTVLTLLTSLLFLAFTKGHMVTGEADCIDANARSAEDVKVKYVENAIVAFENGKDIEANFTRAIGCPVRAK